MNRLGPDVRLEATDPSAPFLHYLPQPGADDLPPLALHPLVAAILAYLDAGWRVGDLERHLASRVACEPEALHEIVADIGVIFRGHFCNSNGGGYVEIGDPEDLLALLRRDGRGGFTSRQILFPDDRSLFPINIEWVVTRYCNRACVYCYQGAILNGKPKDSTLSTERVCEILTEGRRLGAYNYFITGGEPLLRKDSYDILVHALELGMKPDIISKQFIREEDVARLARAGLDSITLSIDSLDAPVATQLTGIKPYAERIAQTVERLTRHGVEVHAKMVMTPLNVGSLTSTLERLEALGVRSLLIEPYAENLQRHSDSLVLSAPEARQVMAEIEQFSARGDREMIVSFDYADPEQATADDHHGDDHGQDCFVCHVSTTALLFMPDGKVGKCDKPLPGDDFELGDLSVQSVHEVWNSPRMVQALKPPRELYAGTMCHDCGDFDICHERARCYYDAYLTNGTLYGPGSNCPYLDTQARKACS